jgi:flavin reductase (DIM6/NTAB) family NADH-FMN oxidoreductase RutF
MPFPDSTRTISPESISTKDLHGYLLGAIAPRPIAFASTINNAGQVNLSPYSFFNVFGSNPPIIIFSASRRVRDNTIKHSLENVMEVPETVVNIVNYNMVQQTSLASTEYAKGVNEFIKAGFTEVASDRVKPPRVGESPASFECVVEEVKATGEEGGAGNLIVCRVVQAHIDENILDKNGLIDPFKLDAMGRMGGNWYCRANRDALIEVAKPLRNKGIGVDGLPDLIKNSNILTGNELGMLGNSNEIPYEQARKIAAEHEEINMIINTITDRQLRQEKLHTIAKLALGKNDEATAWAALLS